MIDAQHPRLSLVRQCQLAGISRSSFYYAPRGENTLNLELMRVPDEQFPKTSWYGSRPMARHLGCQGHCVGRKRVRRLMCRIGLSAVTPALNTSRRHPDHAVYPYLLRDLHIDHAN